MDFDHQDNHKTYTVEAKAGDFIIGEVGTVGIVDVDSVDLWSLLVSNLLIAPEASSCNSYQLLSLQVGKIDVNNGQTLEVIGPHSNFQKSTKPTSNFPWRSDIKSGFHDCNFRECGTLLWMGRSPRGGYPRWLFPETFQSQTF